MNSVFNYPLTLPLAFFSSATIGAELPIHGQPLKSVYRDIYYEGMYVDFFDTGKTLDSYSHICAMGQAIPQAGKEGWYVNEPIPGAKLELRARLVYKVSDKTYKSAGFVVITKNGEVFKTFKPLGDYENGVWDGDFFNTWSHSGAELVVFNGRSGKDGYASFDLIDGNGFYRNTQFSDPSYFLSECRRIKRKGLPVYEYRFVKY